jgi:polyisoprenoid-binding protein YceI
MATERWEIDSSHSGIHFSVRHLVIAKVRGQFSRWSGALVVPDGDFTRASVEAMIDASSIDTGVPDRDAHLKSADFFDVAQFPELIFTATRIEAATPGDELKLVGQLTMKGISREVELQVEQLGELKDPWGNQRAACSAKAAIDRKDFGLAWNQVLETGGLAVGERVTIEIELQAVRQAGAKVA